MDNIVKVECLHFGYDWTDTKKVEIDLDRYVFFEIDYRGDKSWHIKGYKCDSDYNWSVEELSDHVVNGTLETAKFIAYANAYPKSKGKFQGCKVSRFNNLHYSGRFYDELEQLLKMVKQEEQKYLQQEFDIFA